MPRLPDKPVKRKLDGEYPALTTKQAMNAVASLEGPARGVDPVSTWRNVAIVLAHEVQDLRSQLRASNERKQS